MLLVQHHTAQFWHGQEKSRTRAHHQTGLTPRGQCAKRGLAPGRRLIAVIKKERGIRQGAGSVAAQLVGQGHFRSQQQQAFAPRQTVPGQFQIHGRLAAARDAVEQAGSRRTFIQRRAQAGQGRALIRVETEGCGRGRQQGLLRLFLGLLARQRQMPGLEQALQGGSRGLSQALQQTTTAHGPVFVQVFQNFNLTCGRGAHRPGRIGAQQAELFAGRVRAGGQHTGRARAKRPGQVQPLPGVRFPDLAQAQRRRAPRFQPVQAHARAAQSLGQHMAQNMARLHALAKGQILSQSQQIRRQQGGVLQRPADGPAGHVVRQA